MKHKTLLLFVTFVVLESLFLNIQSQAQVPIGSSLEEGVAPSSFLSSLELVAIGDPLNPFDNQGLGSVWINFQIGKYEITAEQYAIFLNAVASQQDPHGLYDERMATDMKVACISVTKESDGAFFYKAISGREKFPIAYVSIADAERFCNWLEHGAPEYVASEEVENITEQGAYLFALSEDRNGKTVISNRQAHYRLPTEDEWIKAAYYKPLKANEQNIENSYKGIDSGYESRYSLYPTGSNSAPSNGYGDLKNQANYQSFYSFLNLNNKQSVLKPVDFFNDSKSPFGCYDMGGNLKEWASSGRNGSNSFVALGGSWQSPYSFYNDNDLMRTAEHKLYSDSAEKTDFIGFRIVYVEDPNIALAAESSMKEFMQAIDSAQNQLSSLSVSTSPKTTVGQKMSLMQGIELLLMLLLGPWFLLRGAGLFLAIVDPFFLALELDTTASLIELEKVLGPQLDDLKKIPEGDRDMEEYELIKSQVIQCRSALAWRFVVALSVLLTAGYAFTHLFNF